ncbi:ABC transporter [Metarhizium brunneum]
MEGLLSHGSPNQFRIIAAPSQQRSPVWLQRAQLISRAGYIQLAMCVLSLLWITAHHVQAPRSANRKAFKPPGLLYFEIAGHVLLSVTVALWISVAIQQGEHWPDVLALLYILLLGILRAALGKEARKMLLNQANIILFMEMSLLLIAEISPLTVIGNGYRPDRFVSAGMLGLASVMAVAATSPREWAPPPECPAIVQGSDVKPAKEDTCSLLDYYCTFGRVNSLIRKGWAGDITTAAFQDLPWNYTPEILYPQISRLRKKYKSTAKTIFMLIPGEIILSTLLAGVYFITELSTPFSLYQLLEYLTNPEDAVFHPYLWLFVMFTGALLESVAQQAFVFLSTRAAIKVKMALTTEMYQRAMASRELEDDFLNDEAEASQESEGSREPEHQAQRKSSYGQLANIMSTDINAVQDGRNVLFIIGGVPCGVTFALIGMYNIVGWPSLIGVGVMLLMSPLPAWIVSHVGGQQKAAKSAQDGRISLSTEYLGAIRVIKYFGWEDAIAKYLQESRAREQKHIWNMVLLYTAMGEAAYLIPILSIIVIYSLYVGVRQLPLTASVAFTTIRLLDIIRDNFSMMAAMAVFVPKISISLGRLDKFYHAATPPESYPQGPLKLENATFRRNKRAGFLLQDISIDFVQGGLNVVSGPSGSGKTTLLLSILGETIKEGGSVTRPLDVAFASQTPWLQALPIRDNVVFNSTFNAERYDTVIDACCLRLDLDELPEGDMTDIGENGSALSGGQRARVALARALYSSSSLLLLDDVFSAIDTKTASGLWNRVFCSDLLKGRTVVLVTQQPWIPEQADLAIALESGKIAAMEQNIGVVRQPRTIAQREGHVEDHGDGLSGSTTPIAKPLTERSSSKVAQESEVDEEVKLTGLSGRLIFLKYMLYFGGPIAATLITLTLVLQIGAEIGTTLWMSHWVDAAAQTGSINIAYYLGMYVAINFCSVIVAGIAYMAFMYGGWVAARRLHGELVKGVLSVSLSWFKDNPVGRVINRLSGDMDTLDQSLPPELMHFLMTATSLIMQTGAVSTVLPVFMLPALVATLLGGALGELYNRTNLTVKQLVASTQSPIFTQFSESLSGLVVVRARSEMPRVFADGLNTLLYTSAKAAGAQRECDQWMKFRINTLAAVVQVSAGMLALSKQGAISAGLVGFSLTAASTMSALILRLVFSINFLNTEMQSFHRVSEYAKLPPEESGKEAEQKENTDVVYADALERTIPADWPRSGRVEFRNVTVRYTLDGPDILKDINLVFNAGERVAIVGRTGSGKSTLVLSLLRFTYIVSGQILYDGVDITAVPRKRLRHAIATIPQEALIFQGTIASNLDPSGEVPQEKLQRAIDACATIAAMQQQSSGTDCSAASAVVNEVDSSTGETVTCSSPDAQFTGRLALSTLVNTGGGNFSHGQRQVLSLCRVLVRRSRLMLLDEATSSMDFVTDAGIQEVLRKDLDEEDGHSRCLITIAHRLRTMADYDRVVVMGSGKVLEDGTPRSLFHKHGVFYDMVLHSGEEDLFAGIS